MKKLTKLTITQKNRLKTMCVACGMDTKKFGVNNPMQKTNPKNWLELCTTELFERIVGYNAQKMSDMMYPFMLGTQNPIDYLFEQLKKRKL